MVRYKKIKNLPEVTNISNDDYVLLEHATSGTYKYPVSVFNNKLDAEDIIADENITNLENTISFKGTIILECISATAIPITSIDTKYFNTTDNKIYISDGQQWASSIDPKENTIYFNKQYNQLMYWNGSELVRGEVTSKGVIVNNIKSNLLDKTFVVNDGYVNPSNVPDLIYTTSGLSYTPSNVTIASGVTVGSDGWWTTFASNNFYSGVTYNSIPIPSNTTTVFFRTHIKLNSSFGMGYVYPFLSVLYGLSDICVAPQIWNNGSQIACSLNLGVAGSPSGQMSDTDFYYGTSSVQIDIDYGITTAGKWTAKWYTYVSPSGARTLRLTLTSAAVPLVLSNTATWALNQGSGDEGFKMNMLNSYLQFNGVTVAGAAIKQSINFKIDNGSAYRYLKATDHEGKQFILNSAINSTVINGWANGNYNVLIDSTGNVVYTKNAIYIQKTLPSNPVNGDYWLDCSCSPYKLCKYSGVIWEITTSIIPIGSLTVTNDAVSNISTLAYNRDLFT